MRFFVFNFTGISMIIFFFSCTVVNNCHAKSLITNNAYKPHIHIIATGGTIAGTGSNSVGSSYKAGTLDIGVLLKTIPEISHIASLSSEQPINIGSQEMDEDIWLILAKRLYELQRDTTVDGIVITHGTDTMDETAFFLSLAVRCSKPVIMVGAVLPMVILVQVNLL
jgi:L-asparaginase